MSIFRFAAIPVVIFCFAVSASPIVSRTSAVSPRAADPLSEARRRRAVIRALRFIDHNALNRRNFARYGSDYLWCFYSIGASVSDPVVASMAQRFGRERAIVWRQQHRAIPDSLTVNDLLDWIFGSDAATSLGVPDDALQREIETAIAKYAVTDYFNFDPRIEGPPADVPEECAFDHTLSPRGSTVCQRCGRRLKMRSRYDIWCEALVTAYSAEHFGVNLGASYADVVKWLPQMRPYSSRKQAKIQDYIQSVYAVTHLIYTLNDFDQAQIPATLLPDEYNFLRQSIPQVIAMRDVDMLGELIDSLKSLGVADSDALLNRGMRFMSARQNADGSWGQVTDADTYDRYHATWNGIVALSDYAWRSTGPAATKLTIIKRANEGTMLPR